jgi:dihydropteroate synthase
MQPGGAQQQGHGSGEEKGHRPVEIIGIVNLTEDSFSDGGRFLDTAAAIAHGEGLLADGAGWLDLGAESSNPAGAAVSAEVEIARLRPVIEHFVRRGTRVAVDTHKAAVMRAALALGAGMINDITALRDPDAAAVLAASEVPVVVMFSRAPGGRAEVAVHPHRTLVAEMTAFFRERLRVLATQGIAAERIILDPGMGFFLGSTPEPSLWILKHLRALGGLGRPLYVSTSRKSFIGALVGQAPGQRLAGTLATELWALSQGVAYVRTHDVRALADAWKLWRAIETVE